MLFLFSSEDSKITHYNVHAKQFFYFKIVRCVFVQFSEEKEKNDNL